MATKDIGKHQHVASEHPHRNESLSDLTARSCGCSQSGGRGGSNPNHDGSDTASSVDNTTDAVSLSTGPIPTTTDRPQPGSGCKMSMLLNRHTIGACFFSASPISGPEAFAAICLGAMLLAVILELARRGVEELDRWVLRNHARRERKEDAKEEAPARRPSARMLPNARDDQGGAASEKAAADLPAMDLVAPQVVDGHDDADVGNLDSPVAASAPAGSHVSDLDIAVEAVGRPLSSTATDIVLTDVDDIALARLSYHSPIPSEPGMVAHAVGTGDSDSKTPAFSFGKSPVPSITASAHGSPALSVAGIDKLASPPPQSLTPSIHSAAAPVLPQGEPWDPSVAQAISGAKSAAGNDPDAVTSTPALGHIKSPSLTPIAEKESARPPPSVGHHPPEHLPGLRQFRPSLWHQILRSLLHSFQFTVAFFIMLLAMYMNVYIITSICLGIFAGSFIFQWDKTIYYVHQEGPVSVDA